MLAAVFWGGSGFGEVGIAFFDPFIGIAVPELAGHRLVGGRIAPVGLDRAFVFVAVGVFCLQIGLGHLGEWMSEREQRLPGEPSS